MQILWIVLSSVAIVILSILFCYLVYGAIVLIKDGVSKDYWILYICWLLAIITFLVFAITITYFGIIKQIEILKGA